jgi:hypothetical protein
LIYTSKSESIFEDVCLLVYYVIHPIYKTLPPQQPTTKPTTHDTPPPAYSFLIASLTISPHSFAVGFALTASTLAISFPYLPPIVKSLEAFSSKSTTDHLASPLPE